MNVIPELAIQAIEAIEAAPGAVQAAGAGAIAQVGADAEKSISKWMEDEVQQVEALLSNAVKRVGDADLKSYRRAKSRKISKDYRQEKIRGYMKRVSQNNPGYEFPASLTTPVDMLDDGPNVNPVSGSLFKIQRSSNMRYGKSPSYRRGKKRKADQAVTRRGVKQMIARRAAFAGSYSTYTIQNSHYFGKVSTATPAPEYNKVWRSDFGIFVHSELVNYRDDLLAKLPTYPSATTIKKKITYCVRKIRWKLWFHNPVNEIVQAKFWFLKSLDAQTASPVLRWQTEYNEQEDVATGSALEDSFSDYPTKYKQFRDNWEIVHKMECTFTAGQTKTLQTKLPGFQWCENDYGHTEGIQQNISYYLMVELKGVPTHQNNAGTQTNSVGWTPAALDMCSTLSWQHAVAFTSLTEHKNENKLDTITVATSYTPDNVGTISVN